jgi:regulator of sigma E protease
VNINSNQPPSENDNPEATTKDLKLGATGRGISIRFWGALVFFFVVLVPYGIYHGPVAFFFGLITFLEVVLLFNILIIVHELGHFLAAKWCGLQIDKFAIWFGKPLWSKKIDGVDYILGSIPAGGYVALPQMAPMEAIEGKTDTPREELPPASPWQKIVVAFAGPLFSFGLALFFACIVWVVGKPVPYSEATTIIGSVQPNYPGGKAGLKPGDKILSIDNHPVNRFMGMGNSVIWRILTSTADTIPIVVQRGSETLTIDVSPQKDVEHDHAWYQRSATRKVGIGPAWEALIIKKELPNSPVETAGLQPGDKITAMNGQPIYAGFVIDDLLKAHPHDPIQFEVEKAQPAGAYEKSKGKAKITYAAPQLVTVVPETPISPSPMPKDSAPTDIGIDEWDPGTVNIVYPTPFEQVRDSVQAVTGTIAALFTPKSNVGPSLLSGPVGIMNILFAVLSSEHGWQYALWLAVLINVNLAMLNLLPLPVLDGGHITLSLIEWIRRRPLSMRILEPLQTACALVLIGYMAFITFFDLQDSGKLAGIGATGEIKFAPKSGTQ